MLNVEEIISHTLEYDRRWALLDGNEMNEDEAEEFAKELLPKALASKLSNAMICMEIVESLLEANDHPAKDRIISQLYNW